MEYNKVAAKWWADKLRNVGPGNFDNGDSSSTGGMTMLLATMLAMDSHPSDEAIDLFEERLAEISKSRLKPVALLPCLLTMLLISFWAILQSRLV